MHKISQTKEDLVALILEIQDVEVLTILLEMLLRLKELKET